MTEAREAENASVEPAEALRDCVHLTIGRLHRLLERAHQLRTQPDDIVAAQMDRIADELWELVEAINAVVPAGSGGETFNQDASA